MVKEKTNSTKEISDKMTEKDDPWMQKVSENKDEKKEDNCDENMIVEEVVEE